MTIVRSITSQPTSCARLNCCEGEISWSMRITSTASCSRIRRSSSRLPVPKYAPDSNPARFCVNLPTTSNPSVFASWRNSVSDASNSTSLTLGNCTAATMARFGFWSISCIMVAEPISDRSIVDEKSACRPARRRARRDAHGRVLAGPGSLEDDRRGGRRRVDLARRTLPLPRNLQGQNRLPLGRRGLSAVVALHDVAYQADAYRMGPADVRNRRHQDAAHGTRLALRRRRTQSGTDPAARQSDTRHLRRPRLLRRLVPAGPGEPGPFLREERRRHLAAQPQPLVARNRRQPDADPRRHRRANRRAPRQLLRRHPARPAALRYRRRTLLASLLRPTGESPQAQRQTIPLHRHTQQTDQRPERSQRSSETTAARGVRRETQWRWGVGRQEVSVPGYLSSAAVHEPAKVRDPWSPTLDNCTAATMARVGFWPGSFNWIRSPPTPRSAPTPRPGRRPGFTFSSLALLPEIRRQIGSSCRAKNGTWHRLTILQLLYVDVDLVRPPFLRASRCHEKCPG